MGLNEKMLALHAELKRYNGMKDIKVKPLWTKEELVSAVDGDSDDKFLDAI